MTALTHKRAKVNGVNFHYVVTGSGPVVLCMHGWPQNHREFLPIINALADRYTFIAPDLRGYADSDKPRDGYEPLTIADDMLGVLDIEGVSKFHILSHDLGGPPSVALAYKAEHRALSLATIETPFFGLDSSVARPRPPHWHRTAHLCVHPPQRVFTTDRRRCLRHEIARCSRNERNPGCCQMLSARSFETLY